MIEVPRVVLKLAAISLDQFSKGLYHGKKTHELQRQAKRLAEGFMKMLNSEPKSEVKDEPVQP